MLHDQVGGDCDRASPSGAQCSRKDSCSVDADNDVRCTWAGTQVFANSAPYNFVALATHSSSHQNVAADCAIDRSVANMFLIPLGTDSNRWFTRIRDSMLFETHLTLFGGSV